MKNILIVTAFLLSTNIFGQNFFAANEEVNATSATVTENVEIVKNLYFAENVSFLNKDSQSSLNAIFKLMLNNTSVNIAINSYTDETESNKNLSNKRALAAKKYLVSKGISSKRLKVNNFGTTKQLNEFNAQELERRVEFIIE